MRIEPYQPDDFGFLRRMLAMAVFWRDDALPSDYEVRLDRPGVTPIFQGWGREHDTALVAYMGDRRVGAAWYRTFTVDNHSYGFVDEFTPELGVGVEHDTRGRGVGTALLNQLLDAAETAGLAAVSLSVELENPARRLYQRLGFEDHIVNPNDATMIRRLDG